MYSEEYIHIWFYFYMWLSECLCTQPPDYYVEILMAIVMILEDRAFGGYLGHKDGALMNGISICIKEIQQNSIVPSTR